MHPVAALLKACLAAMSRFFILYQALPSAISPPFLAIFCHGGIAPDRSR